MKLYTVHCDEAECLKQFIHKSEKSVEEIHAEFKLIKKMPCGHLYVGVLPADEVDERLYIKGGR